MDGREQPGLSREERRDKRFRALLVEERRTLITRLKAIDRYLAEEDADDEGGIAILPGHSADLPRSGNRPPANMTNHR